MPPRPPPPHHYLQQHPITITIIIIITITTANSSSSHQHQHLPSASHQHQRHHHHHHPEDAGKIGTTSSAWERAERKGSVRKRARFTPTALEGLYARAAKGLVSAFQDLQDLEARGSVLLGFGLCLENLSSASHEFKTDLRRVVLMCFGPAPRRQPRAQRHHLNGIQRAEAETSTAHHRKVLRKAV